MFISFLERDAFRQRRRRGARRTLFISLAIHLTALLALVLASFWQVDELWTPSVKVTLFPSSATPPGVTEPTPPGAPTPSGSRVR